MDDNLTKIIIAIIGALAATGIVVTITIKIVRTVNKSRKNVRLRQGGISVREINNNATIDQSDKK